jgi:hypothetical protein
MARCSSMSPKYFWKSFDELNTLKNLVPIMEEGQPAHLASKMDELKVPPMQCQKNMNRIVNQWNTTGCPNPMKVYRRQV